MNNIHAFYKNKIHVEIDIFTCIYINSVWNVHWNVMASLFCVLLKSSSIKLFFICIFTPFLQFPLISVLKHYT